MNAAKPPAVIAGSSHLTCLGVPLRSPDGDLSLVPVDESRGAFLYLSGPFPREEPYWVELERLAADHKLFICWRGNQHMAQYLFASRQPFDFVLSDEPELPIAERSVLVPEQMLREAFAPSFDRLETLLQNVHRGRKGAVICGTPPPKGDIAAIRASLENEYAAGLGPHFVDWLADLGLTAESVPITTPETLYKMWRLIQTMLRDVATKYHAQFVPVPAEAQTSTGFLRQEFWSSDVTHPNREFGRLILRVYREYL